MNVSRKLDFMMHIRHVPGGLFIIIMPCVCVAPNVMLHVCNVQSRLVVMLHECKAPSGIAVLSDTCMKSPNGISIAATCMQCSISTSGIGL